MASPAPADLQTPAGRWVVACLKWVALRPEIDPLTGAVAADERFSGASPADEAALEWALRMGERWSAPVAVVTVGPPVADTMLREALACGAVKAIRIQPGSGRHQPSSHTVAHAIAAQVIPWSPVVVIAGDASLDRGSASVPPLLAHHLRAAQACGLVSLDPGPEPGTFSAERRLDGGRRERIETPPDRPGETTVLSVESGTARLRRAPLASVLASQRATIEVRPLESPGPGGTHVASVGPFRPRPKQLDAPAGSDAPMRRIVALTGALSDRTPPQRLVLEPAAAAEKILEQLEAWGYRSG